MARTATSETLASHIYAEIRAEILNGGFEPGQRLKVSDLRLRFGVSVSVIREALSRLAEQRLVRGEHNQGFQVTSLSEKDLRDLTDLRIEIEGYALRLSVERGDFVWESKVVSAHHLLSVTPMHTGDQAHRHEGWSAAHGDFHRALIEGCDMPMLLDIRGSLFDASELYRRLSVPLAEGNRDIGLEHRELMEAALARDSELACSRLASHIGRTTAVVLAALLDGPPKTSAPKTSAPKTSAPRVT